MKQVLLIPVVGTIAAVVAVALAHRERESDLYPIKIEPAPRAPLADGTPDETEDKETEPKAPAPVPGKYLVELEEDGTFSVVAKVKAKEPPPATTYETIEKFLDAAAPEGGPRPNVHLYATSDKVTKEQLEEVATRLRDRCEVVVQHG